MIKEATTQQWVKALIALQEGERFSQLLNIMSGGEISFIQWELSESDTAEFYLEKTNLPQKLGGTWIASTVPWNCSGIYQDTNGIQGLIVVKAFSKREEVSSADLLKRLQWLQSMQRSNTYPIRIILLAFSRVPDEEEISLKLETWQWEAILETELLEILGQNAQLQEVLVFPLVAYSQWMN